MKKYRRLKDERISKESEKLIAKMYLFIISLLIISLAGKAIMGIAYKRYIIEILCLIASTAYMIFSFSKYKIRLFTNVDAVLSEIRTGILSKCGMICFWIIIIGEFIFLFLGFLQIVDVLLYLIIWVIPALVITYYSIKNGLLIWGGTKRKASGKNALAKNTSIGALFFGIILGGPHLYFSGTFHASGILWILGLALGWGLPFYFIFKLMINRGEKNADKQANELESEAGMLYEKQTDENSQDRK